MNRPNAVNRLSGIWTRAATAALICICCAVPLVVGSTTTANACVYNGSPGYCNQGALAYESQAPIDGAYNSSVSIYGMDYNTACGEQTGPLHCGDNRNDVLKVGANLRPMQLIITNPAGSAGDFLAVGYGNGCLIVAGCSGVNSSNGGVYKKVYWDGQGPGGYYAQWFNPVSAGTNITLEILATGGNCFNRYQNGSLLGVRCYNRTETSGFVTSGSENACNNCGVGLHMDEFSWGPSAEYHNGQTNGWFYWGAASYNNSPGCAVQAYNLNTSNALVQESGIC